MCGIDVCVLFSKGRGQAGSCVCSVKPSPNEFQYVPQVTSIESNLFLGPQQLAVGPTSGSAVPLMSPMK